jgi:Thioredoxin
MTQLLLVPLLIAVAVAIATLLNRRRPSDPPTQRSFAVPTQLDRGDFVDPTKPWLVAVFTSATCSTCSLVASKAAVLASADVAVQEVEATASAALHRRYSIDAVPTTVVVDHSGVVQTSWLGPVSATDLWAGVARLRDGGDPTSCER